MNSAPNRMQSAFGRRTQDIKRRYEYLAKELVRREGDPAALPCLRDKTNQVRMTNGEVASTGVGVAVLGSLLKAGYILLAGELGSMVTVAPSDHIETRIEGLGSVRVHFEALT